MKRIIFSPAARAKLCSHLERGLARSLSIGGERITAEVHDFVTAIKRHQGPLAIEVPRGFVPVAPTALPVNKLARLQILDALERDTNGVPPKPHDGHPRGTVCYAARSFIAALDTCGPVHLSLLAA